MEGSHKRLDDIDRATLHSYRAMIKGLSAYLGEGYELVLHSLEDYDHSVIEIVNGYHTGRSVGAPLTDLALEFLKKFEKGGEDNATYCVKNSKGEPMKSTTIAIRGSTGAIIGLMCVNFYLNTPFSQVLNSFSDCSSEKRIAHRSEHFTDNVDDLIESAVTAARTEVYANPSISSSNKNKEIIYSLSRRGIFNLKDGVIKTAGILGISKNTVYMHLRNFGDDS